MVQVDPWEKAADCDRARGLLGVLGGVFEMCRAIRSGTRPANRTYAA